MQIGGMPLAVGSTLRFSHFCSIDGDSFQREMTSRALRGHVTLRNSICNVAKMRGAVKPAAAIRSATANEIFLLTLMANVLRLHPRRRVSTLPPSSQRRSPSQEVRETPGNAVLYAVVRLLFVDLRKNLGKIE